MNTRGYTIFGETLCACMEARKGTLTWLDLAEQTSFSYTSITERMRGKQEPDEHFIQEIICSFKVNNAPLRTDECQALAAAAGFGEVVGRSWYV